MRFFLTDDVPELEAELRRIGHEVVGGPGERVSTVCAGTTWEPKTYNVVPFIQSHRPDVCLFVDPLRLVEFTPGKFSEFGHGKDSVTKTRGTRNCITIGFTRVGSDPAITARYRSGMCPKCVAGPSMFGLWATADAATAQEQARERRCALWRPGEGGAAGLVAMVESVLRREAYRTGREGRVYGG